MLTDRILGGRILSGQSRSIAAIAAALWLCDGMSASAECRLQPGPRRTVARVIDGETLMLDDGSEVRLSGSLAPRGLDARIADADWPLAVAATAALSKLAVGHTVALGYSGSSKFDRQGRHVAQVFVVDGEKETWVQGELLAHGQARAYQLKDHRGCAAELVEFEQMARRSGQGVWASGAYQVRQASRSRDLGGEEGRFVTLVGRVNWVAEGRQAIALGFSPARSRASRFQRGVVVMIENGDRDLLGSIGGDAKALEGRLVEVRGWPEQRLGRPRGSYVMDVSVAGMLRLADEPQPEPTSTTSEHP